MTPSQPKAFVLPAARAPGGVVLYRRSNRTTYVLQLDREDRLHRGSRFYGRLFPERCDVSPDGKLMVYFAMRGRKTGSAAEPSTWTAVCSPPWLKAHLFCPNGSTWGGGGVFLEDQRLVVIDNPEDPGVREVKGYRLVRNTSELSLAERQLLKHKVNPPSVAIHAHPSARKDAPFITRRRKDGVASGYDAFDHELRRGDGAEFPGAESIILANWAGWDSRGRLLAAWGSVLHIYEVDEASPLPKPHKIFDLESAINASENQIPDTS